MNRWRKRLVVYDGCNLFDCLLMWLPIQLSLSLKIICFLVQRVSYVITSKPFLSSPLFTEL
jgi:hypothetical protein